MTKQEILDSLEGLKDLTNDSGKRTIDGIKAAVMGLLEPGHTKKEVEQKPEPEIKEEPFRTFNKVEHPKKAAPRSLKHSKR